MAFIPNLKSKQEACSSINSKISTIKSANFFLLQKQPEHTHFALSFRIPVPNDYDEKYSTSIICGDNKIFDPMVLAYQKELAADIRKLAKIHEIALTDEEEKIVSEIEKKHFKDVACIIDKE